MTRNSKGSRGGIPWTAILDADGKVLATSNDAKGQNIGFPSEKPGIDHFVGMIQKTAIRAQVAADVHRVAAGRVHLHDGSRWLSRSDLFRRRGKVAKIEHGPLVSSIWGWYDPAIPEE